MSMSHERVKFYLPKKYIELSGMQKAMRRAFDVSSMDFHTVFTGSHSGRWIVCRPSQFARFLIYRAELVLRCSSSSMVNGFQDLQATLFVPEEEVPSVYEVWNRPHQRYHD